MLCSAVLYLSLVLGAVMGNDTCSFISYNLNFINEFTFDVSFIPFSAYPGLVMTY